MAHELAAATTSSRVAWSASEPDQALNDGGLPLTVARDYVAGHPELAWTADHCSQVATDLVLRIPTVRWAEARNGNTWLYDFRWPVPSLGLAFHCLELPFTWDLLDAEGVITATRPDPPQELADRMHAAWVRFVATGDPGWGEWDGHNALVFGAEQRDYYAVQRPIADIPARVDAY